MVAAVATVLLAWLPAARAGDYIVTDLTSLYGQFTTASGINDNGQVVGYSKPTLLSQNSGAFIWDPAGGMNYLGTFGETTAVANGINNAGQVVGTTKTGNLNKAFVWSAGAGVKLLDTSALGSYGAQGMAINSSGQVAGNYRHGFDFTKADHAMVWDPASDTLTDLSPDLPSYGSITSSYGYGINNAGQVVGIAPSTGWPNVGTTAYRWTPGSDPAQRYTDLGSLVSNSSGRPSIAFAVDSAGTTAVGSSYYDNVLTHYQHAFVWRSGSGMTDLGTLGHDGSQALALNNSGQVVGKLYDANKGDRAFIYDINTAKMTDLNTLISTKAGWTLWDATGINSQGQIAGGGYTTDNTYHAFVLTPVTDRVSLTSGTAAISAMNDSFATGGFSKAGLGSNAAPIAATIQLNGLTLDGTFATLRYAYDPAELAALGITEESMRLYWYNPTSETWSLAGDASNNTKNLASGFVLGAPSNVLGDWGIDTANDFVWANIDHASTYGMSGVVPEPSTMILLAMGGLAVLRRRAGR